MIIPPEEGALITVEKYADGGTEYRGNVGPSITRCQGLLSGDGLPTDLFRLWQALLISTVYYSILGFRIHLRQARRRTWFTLQANCTKSRCDQAADMMNLARAFVAVVIPKSLRNQETSLQSVFLQVPSRYRKCFAICVALLRLGDAGRQ